MDAGFSLNKLMNRTLYMQVLDYDRFSRDDPIGEVCIPISEIDLSTSQTLWRNLQPCKGHSVSSTLNCRSCNIRRQQQAARGICLWVVQLVGRPCVRPSVNISRGGTAVKEPCHFEVRKSSSQITRMHFFLKKVDDRFVVVALKTQAANAVSPTK